MKRVGISEAQIFTIAGGPPGKMLTMAPQFFEMVEFAAQECERLGMTLALHNCPGWSNAGGPWIKPEQSMKEVTFSEIEVKGPTVLEQKLPMPPQKQNFYRDIALLVFPTPSDEETPVGPGNRATFTTNAPGIDLSGLEKGAIDGRSVQVNGVPDKDRFYIQVEFEQPVTLSTALLKVPAPMGTGGYVQISEDGINFKAGPRYELKPLDAAGYAHVEIGSKPVKLKAIRFPFEWSIPLFRPSHWKRVELHPGAWTGFHKGVTLPLCFPQYGIVRAQAPRGRSSPAVAGGG